MSGEAPRDGALGFSDARGCRQWVGSLPLTNIPQAQSQVLELVRALNGATFPPLERLKCLELVREKVAFLQSEQRARYLGKSLPLSANDNAAWATGAALLAAMEAGYHRCLQPDCAELAAHRALIMQRAMRFAGALMLFHGIAYRRFEPALWQRLHAQYAEAEAEGIADERVKDSLAGDGEGASSVAEAYLQVVLLQAAYLAEMSGAQIDFVEALLRQWLRKLRWLPVAEARGRATVPLAVDLASSIGARPAAAAELDERHRVVDVEGLSMSLRKRLHALQSEEQDAAQLGLPPQAAGIDLPAELKRLHKLWCEGAPPRPAGKASEVKSAGLVFTIPEIHFFTSGGKPFEQPGKSRELTSQEKQDIEVFGRITERTQSRLQAEHNYTADTWTVVDEMPGAWRLQRPASASKGVAIARIAAVRLGDAGAFFLGVVRALVQETDGRIVATVVLLPGKPEPIAVRAGDARHRTSAQWSPGLRLPRLERLQIPASLVVPAALAARGRGIEIWHDGGARESTVYEVLEHGADFDRITVF